MLKSESDICINGYELLTHEGNGSIGSVFKAIKNKKYYAVKMINQIEMQSSVAEYINQVQSLQELQQQQQPQTLNNIVQIIEVIKIPLNLFIVMEYCNQGNLVSYIYKQPHHRLHYIKAIELYNDILNGFKYIQQQNIQHYFTKLSNILMHNDKPKISDYGMYLLQSNNQYADQQREFMSPESYEKTVLRIQSKSNKNISEINEISGKCDIWGLGVLLFYMLFGSWPFIDIDDIKKYTYQKQINIPELLQDKNILEQKCYQQLLSIEIFQMVREIMSGIFKYDPKERMDFSQLHKHRIFIKIKHFNNLEQSFFFYLQPSMNNNYYNYKSNKQQQSQLSSKQSILLNKSLLLKQSITNNINLFGLPGVSARSDILDEQTDKQQMNISNKIQMAQISKPHKVLSNLHEQKLDLDVAQDLSAKFDLNVSYQQQLFSGGKEFQAALDIALALDLGGIFPKLSQQVSSFNQIINSAGSDKFTKNSNNDKSNKHNIHLEFKFSEQDQNEGSHCSPLILSGFGKMILQNKERKVSYHRQSKSQQSSRSTYSYESECNFCNIEEFDSYHKDKNHIPQFRINQACKLINFQFDNKIKNIHSINYSRLLKSQFQIDSYSLSSVLSFPKHNNSLYLQYDLDIYTYRFIEQTITLLKNIYYDYHLFSYQQIIQCEYISYKIIMQICQSLQSKLEQSYFKRPEDCLEQLKQSSTSAHFNIMQKYIDIISYDLSRLSQNYFLTCSLFLNQQITTTNSNNNSRMIKKDKLAVSKFKEQNEQMQTLLKNNHIKKSFQYPSPHKNNLDFLKYDNHDWIDDLQFNELNLLFQKEMKGMVDKLQQKYLACKDKVEDNESLSIQLLKLSLRVSMCIRHQDVFDKNKMEKILLYFEATSNFNNSFSQNNAINGSHILTFVPNNSGTFQQISKPSCGSFIGTSLSYSNVQGKGVNNSSYNSNCKLKSQQQQSQQLVNIGQLIKWINNCSEQDIIRQIQLLIGEQ